MDQAATITRGLLSDQVKDRLLQAILDGRYPPGSRIVETRVAGELGVSQAPVREALRDLGALGLVEMSHFRGARVRRPSKTELLEAFAIRAELESLGAGLAIGQLADEDLEELQALVEQIERFAASGDVPREAQADVAFHARVVQLAGNGTLVRVWRYLEPVARTYLTLGAPGIDDRRLANLHQPIVDAFRLRDAPAAIAAVHRHFALAAAEFEAFFESPVEATGPVGRRRARLAGA